MTIRRNESSLSMAQSGDQPMTHIHSNESSSLSLSQLGHQSSSWFPSSSPPLKRHPRGYVVLIGSVNYDIGIQILVCRLRQYSPDIPIFVLVDETIKLKSRAFYKALRADIIPVSNPVSKQPDKQGYKVGTYAKLAAWNLESRVEKAVFIDADALPVQNPQELFDLLSDDTDFAVCGNRKYFNSGVFAFRPSNATYHELLRRLQVNDYSKVGKGPRSDQDVMVSLFGPSNRTKFIPTKFNFRAMQQRQGLRRDTKIVHWIGNPKPWMIFGQATNVSRTIPEWSRDLYQCELNRYFSVCHDYETAVSSSSTIQDCFNVVRQKFPKR
jgi:Glycosyl transferase family 8